MKRSEVSALIRHLESVAKFIAVMEKELADKPAQKRHWKKADEDINTCIRVAKNWSLIRFKCPAGVLEADNFRLV